MDSTSTSSITDDQELAKVLESMNQQTSAPVVPAADEQTDTPPSDTDVVSTPDETPAPEEEAPAADEATAPAEAVATETVSEPATGPEPAVTPEAPAVEPAATPTFAFPGETSSASEPTVPSDLDTIKKSALEELRPLVDKLDLPADEKFDTLLLLIRSTDDKTLVSAAHEAARGITDETKRAQALLDVIKEIDYFSGHGQAPK